MPPRWQESLIRTFNSTATASTLSFDVDLEGLSGRIGNDKQVKEAPKLLMPAPCFVYPPRQSHEGSLGLVTPDNRLAHNHALVVVEGPQSYFAIKLQRLASVVVIKHSEILKYLASAVLVGGLVGYFVNQIPALH